MTRRSEAHKAAARSAVARLDYRKAEAELRAALDDAERSHAVDQEVLEILRELVNVQLRGYESADLIEPFARRLLDLQERVTGTEATEFIIALDLLAQAVTRLNRYQEAETLLRRAVALREKLTGPHAPRLAGDLHALGVRLWGNRRFAESEAVFRRAVDILANNREDPSTIGMGAVLDCLAMLYDAWGQPARAEQVIHERLELAAKHGDDELERAASFERLAKVYREPANYDASESAYRTAIELRARWLKRTIAARRFRTPAAAGTRASLRASMSRQIGWLYYLRAEPLRELGRTPEARRCERLAKRALERSLALEEGRREPGTHLAEAVAALARFYRASGKHTEAAPLYERAISLFRHAAVTYTAPKGHAATSHVAIREMFDGWADALAHELRDMGESRSQAS